MTGQRRALTIFSPRAHKSRNPLAGAFITESQEVGMHLLRGAPILSRFPRLHHQPG